MLRFPHLPEVIFQKLDNESLFKSREVARSWQNMIDGRNYPWLRIVNIPKILQKRNTYLHLAAETGQIKAFTTAFNEEKNINIKNEFGVTIFHRACENGRFLIVQFLLENTDMQINVDEKDNQSIDLNAKTEMGRTAFNVACFEGHADVVKLLIDSATTLRIDLNTKDAYFKTAFLWACIEGHTDVVKVLMDNAAAFNIDLNAMDQSGMTAFHSACEGGFSDVVQIFMENASLLSINLNTKCESDNTIKKRIKNKK
jgi:ankyrin repeat protein